MNENVDKAISVLVGVVSGDSTLSPDAAMKLTQAALNMAHMNAMLNAERRAASGGHIELSHSLAHAIIDMDDIGFGEGMGPSGPERVKAWLELVSECESLVDRVAFSTRKQYQKRVDQ